MKLDGSLQLLLHSEDSALLNSTCISEDYSSCVNVVCTVAIKEEYREEEEEEDSGKDDLHSIREDEDLDSVFVPSKPSCLNIAVVNLTGINV